MGSRRDSTLPRCIHLIANREHARYFFLGTTKTRSTHVRVQLLFPFPFRFYFPVFPQKRAGDGAGLPCVHFPLGGRRAVVTGQQAPGCSCSCRLCLAKYSCPRMWWRWWWWGERGSDESGSCGLKLKAGLGGGTRKQCGAACFQDFGQMRRVTWVSTLDVGLRMC